MNSNSLRLQPKYNAIAKTYFFLTTFFMLAMAIPTAVLAQDPPQYELTWIGEGRPRDINESELVTFGWSPYLYDHSTGIKHNLNELSGAKWYDGENEVTGQWTVWHSNGINELDQIIGTASHDQGAESDRNFVLNDPLGETPVFELLPIAILDGSTYNVCINDNGEVAAGREINNEGLIVTAAGTVGWLGGSFEVFEEHSFTGVNNSGMITGYRYSKKGKNGWGNGGPILFDYPGEPGPEDLVTSGTASNYHGDLNDLNDVAYSSGGIGYVYIFESDTAFNLDDQIVNDSTSQAYLDWINTSIFPSGINDKKQIIGQAQIDGVWNGFILTPVVPGPGITVSAVNGDLTTSEDGDTAVLKYVLDTRPAGNVIISLNSSDPSVATVSPGSLTFTQDDWSTSQSVIVTGQDDDPAVVGDVSYSVTATPSGNDFDYNALDPVVTSLTNLDNDAITLALSVDDPSITEGNNGDQTPGQFTVTLSGPATGDEQVWYDVTNGTANKNRDYKMVDSASDLLSFSPGETTITVHFLILGDNKNESDETFTLTLSGAVGGATIAKAVGTTTILDDE